MTLSKMEPWTEEQAKAIASMDSTLLSASAGTGKTSTIMGKILWTLGLDIGPTRSGKKIPPCPDPLRLEQIAAITFTKRAAHDLRKKVREGIQYADKPGEILREFERATIVTIHKFSAELMREHALRLGIDPSFQILDSTKEDIYKRDTVREVLVSALGKKDRGAINLLEKYKYELEGRGAKHAGIIDRIISIMQDLRWHEDDLDAWSKVVKGKPWKRTLDHKVLRERARRAGAWSDKPKEEAMDEASLEIADTLYRLGQASVDRWLLRLKKENVRDNDSLILDTKQLLTDPLLRAGTLEAIQQRYQLLIIDEFQDTDSAQWDIARAIAPLGRTAPCPKLFIVGDAKQSIYRFRGANIDVWNTVGNEFDRKKKVRLELSENFRSRPLIVELVNKVCKHAFADTAEKLDKSSPTSVVRYDNELKTNQKNSSTAKLEWLPIDGHLPNKEEKSKEEARLVAARIRKIIDHETVTESGDKPSRQCRPKDIGVLAYRKADILSLEDELRKNGIKFFNTATQGLHERQEILDLVTALHLIDNRFDDLRAFAFLRSPFVGLRDEILVRIGLYEVRDTSTEKTPPTLLQKAEVFLDDSDRDKDLWFNDPESDEIAGIERTALQRGLAALREAHGLVDRADHTELLEGLLTSSDYRLHLLIPPEGANESLANIDRFLALLDENRNLTLRRFLSMWERWKDADSDSATSQARLHSSAEDVVLLSTIHSAKGGEWPVVILTGTDAALPDPARLQTEPWIDTELGPIHLPGKSERGPRGERALKRRLEQEEAESARLFYVALTRAQDRLIVVAQTKKSHTSLKAKKLSSVNTWQEIVDKVATAVHKAEANSWITGHGWDEEKWTESPDPMIEGLPIHGGLSAKSPKNPVVLTHASGDASFVNARALEIAGITRNTENPIGGEIVRDGSGEPTGMLRETARHLVVVPPEKIGFNKWLYDELKRAREAHETGDTERDAVTAIDPGKSTSYAEDERTGTGKQIDAFRSENSDSGQLDLDFNSPNKIPEPIHSHDGFVIIRPTGEEEQLEFEKVPVELQWISQIKQVDRPTQTRQIEITKCQWVGSATELMKKDQDIRQWELQYRHGVLKEDDYLPVAEEGEQLPGKIHGTVIHGVLERIRTVEEIGRVIEETISSLDFPDLESVVAAGSTYRHILEEEIARVVSSPEWHWYVEGEHGRELPFMHLSKDGWIQGAFDLYRPVSRESVASGQVSLFEDSPFCSNEETSWVIDFKTHRVDATEVNTIAEDYAIQAQVYREAATALGGDDQDPRVALHFTHSNVVVEI
jgi:ATP-dependent helicase/nuclease subunit A